MKFNDIYLYGRNAILEAIAGERKIEKIFIAFGTQGDKINRIFSQAKKNKIAVAKIDKRKFQMLEKNASVPKGKSQGVIALMRTFDLLSIDGFIKKAFEKDEKPLVVLLDEISDPQNLGAIARSVECAGGAGIITTTKNSAPISPTAVKASAGALETVLVAKADSLVQAIEKLKEHGFWVLGTAMDGEKYYTETFYDTPIAIVIGSEGKGIRPSTRKHCDILVKIPLFGKIDSLNASVTAALMLYEAVRQRSAEKK
jgi:23S rRNA (guanosine2251-2'-O)-methyltransferase